MHILFIFHYYKINYYLIKFYSFSKKSLGVSLYKIMSPISKDNFTSSCSICMSFISFTYSIALSKTSSIMLNKSCERGSLTLSSASERKHSFTFSISVIGFLLIPFVRLRKVSFMHSLLSFYHE